MAGGAAGEWHEPFYDQRTCLVLKPQYLSNLAALPDDVPYRWSKESFQRVHPFLRCVEGGWRCLLCPGSDGTAGLFVQGAAVVRW